MGLDMYLMREEYVGGWDHTEAEEKERFWKVLEAMGWPMTMVTANSPHLEVSACVAYWRKANAIHNWFIQNCAGGVDDCRPVYVSREQLEELRDIAKDAMEAFDRGEVKEAVRLLTPTPGFFFGSTEPDEYYRQDLEFTVNELTKVLESPPGADFYYRASW